MFIILQEHHYVLGLNVKLKIEYQQVFALFYIVNVCKIESNSI